jgi:opacity protein-like surface antigen
MNMNKIAVTFLSLAIALPAAASDMYVGLKAGSAKHDITVSGYSESVRAAGIFAGYKVHPDLAIEAEVTNLGTIDNGVAKVTAVSIGVIGSYSLDESASLFAKLGAASTREEVPQSDVRVSKLAATIGLGAQYELNEDFAVRLGWERYSYGGENLLYDATASMISLSVLEKF